MTYRVRLFYYKNNVDPTNRFFVLHIAESRHIWINQHKQHNLYSFRHFFIVKSLFLMLSQWNILHRCGRNQHRIRLRLKTHFSVIGSPWPQPSSNPATTPPTPPSQQPPLAPWPSRHHHPFGQHLTILGCRPRKFLLGTFHFRTFCHLHQLRSILRNPMSPISRSRRPLGKDSSTAFGRRESPLSSAVFSKPWPGSPIGYSKLFGSGNPDRNYRFHISI